MAIKSIFHLNINCTDHARSRAFYEMLGFRAVHEIPEGSDPQMARALGLPTDARAKATIMMIDPDDQRSCRIDLIQWMSPPTEGRAYPSLHHAGVARVALFTTGLDAEYQRLAEAGVTFISEPVTMRGDIRFVCFEDPDGVILELIELPRS